MKSRRPFVQSMARLALLLPLVGTLGVHAAGKPAANASGKKMVKLTFGIINYTSRVIHDVAINGHGWGLAPPYYGFIGAMLSTPFELGGPQKLTWKDAATGEVFEAKNPIFIREEEIPAASNGTPTLCIHIYPNLTAEVTYTGGEIPKPTERGLVLLKERGK